MRNHLSKQLYITSFDYPLNSVKALFFKSQTFDLLYKKEECFIKMFIGSDWSIIDSGFCYFGPNNIKLVYKVSKIDIHDFEYINKYLLTHINDEKNEKYIELVLSLICNTSNNSTIIEYRLEYEKESDFEYFNNIIDISLMKKILFQFCSEVKNLFKNYNKENMNKLNNIESLKVNHSFIIKKNYKEAFNFFYNWENIAKSIKTDGVWIIKRENEPNDNSNYKNFSVIINENIKTHYQISSINEEKDKIEIVYNKTANSSPALNTYIKLEFINLSKDVCYFLYETHLPINITSSVFNTISDYVYYCNKKSKDYFENNK